MDCNIPYQSDFSTAKTRILSEDLEPIGFDSVAIDKRSTRVFGCRGRAAQIPPPKVVNASLQKSRPWLSNRPRALRRGGQSSPRLAAMGRESGCVATCRRRVTTTLDWSLGGKANKKEGLVESGAVVSNCWGLALMATVGLALSSAASAMDYKVGCVNGACMIVDDTGRVSYFAVGDKTVAEGAEQLKAPIERIRPPLNISCSSAPGGDKCVITDADGFVWVGPLHAGQGFGDPVTRIPVPGPQ